MLTLLLLLTTFTCYSTVNSKDIGVDGSFNPVNDITWKANLPSTPLHVTGDDVVYFQWHGVSHSLITFANQEAFDNCDMSQKTAIYPAVNDLVFTNSQGPNGLVLYFASDVPGDCGKGVKRTIVWGNTLSPTTFHVPPTPSPRTRPPVTQCRLYKKRPVCLATKGCTWKKNKCVVVSRG
jgi:hypothetical protein